MGISRIKASSGPFLLKAKVCPTSPILFKSILESWCNINCSAGWRAEIVVPQGMEDSAEGMALTLDTVDDLMLFMMSSEYGHMGHPEPTRVAF